MKKILAIAFLFAGVTFAQSAPNCNQLNQLFTAAVPGVAYPSTSIKCVAWTFSYFSVGFSALNVQVEFAPDAGGAPGAFTVIPVANLVNGVTLPLTNIVSGTVTINGYFPWMRINVTSKTGTGTINASLIGNSYVGAASQITSSTTTVSAVVHGPDASGVAPTQAPVLVAGQDGTNVRTIRTNTAGRAEIGNVVLVVTADNLANHVQILEDPSNVDTSPLLITPVLWNNNSGSTGTFSKQRAATGSTFSTPIAVGAAIAEKGPRWQITSAPAAGSQATATRAAGGAGVIHVADCVSFAGSAVVAPAATILTVSIIDGASGGTAIWSTTVSSVVGGYIPPFGMCGLNLTGSAATAMTVEFSALLANQAESVTLSGFDVN